MTALLPGQTDPEQYDFLLQEKCNALKKRFAIFSTPEAIIFPSAPQAYRLRAEFRIWHEKQSIYYAMMSAGKDKTPRRIDHFSPGSKTLQQLMPNLLEQLDASPVLSQQLFQVEFLSSLKGEVLVTLIYHRSLDEHWIEQARQLKLHFKKNLSPSISSVHIIGRSRGQKINIGQDFIYETFNINNKIYTYQQMEGCFSQPNGTINEKMLHWASSVTQGIGGDLLELYCGNGNFTLPLSKNFNKVLATEVSKTSIQALLHNLSLNQINNIAIARLSSAEAVQAINRVRPFRRLAGITLDDYQFSTIFVDPPRAGIDTETLAFVQQFDHICYISCSPDSLIANLNTLTQTHRIKHLAFFDQFPYTEHMECGVFLVRCQQEDAA